MDHVHAFGELIHTDNWSTRFIITLPLCIQFDAFYFQNEMRYKNAILNMLLFIRVQMNHVQSVDLYWETHLCHFSDWKVMCMVSSQSRNAVVQPGWKKIANKTFCTELNNATHHFPQGSLCSLELVINGLTSPPTFLYTKEGRGAVIGTPTTQAASMWDHRSLLCWLASHQTKDPSLLSWRCASFMSH